MLSKNSLTFIIPTRKGSARVKNKNIKKFANTSLLELKVKQIKRCFAKYPLLVSTNCPASIKICKKNNVKFDTRPEKFCTNKVPMKKVYSYLAGLVKTDYICYVNVTSPLILDQTMISIFKKFNKIKKKYKCITTTSIFKEYFWFKNKALNYNPDNHPRSQDLPNYHALNFAVTIIDAKYMKFYGKIISNNFFKYPINFPENIDIDYDYQFKLAEIIYKKKLFFFKNT